MVELTPGLAGAGGPLGMAEGLSRRLSIATDLMATGARGSAWRNHAEIELSFNNPVEIDALREVVFVEPPVKFALAGTYGNGVNLHGAFVPGNRYAVKITPAPAGADAKKFPRSDVLSVFVPDCNPEVWFEHAQGYLGSAGNRMLLAHAIK